MQSAVATKGRGQLVTTLPTTMEQLDMIWCTLIRHAIKYHLIICLIKHKVISVCAYNC